jgi:pimeloyl-ACP methyl ester carboxylesterase
MSILSFTGWQQHADALDIIAPGSTHFEYSSFDNMEDVLSRMPPHCELAIGWSLGGQLLLRAIHANAIKPDRILLLGVPFQCVASADFPEGVTAANIEDTKNNYTENPSETLKQLNALIGLGDKLASAITRTLNENLVLWGAGIYWLEELKTFSCNSLDFSHFPQTTIIHGTEDKVIYPANAHKLAKSIPNATLQFWPECAHAPHLHDPEALKKLITNHV